MLCLLKCFKGNVDFQLPRRKFCGVIASTGVVFGNPLLQVRSMTDVAASGMTDAFKIM
jgi:hypothetical protein